MKRGDIDLDIINTSETEFQVIGMGNIKIVDLGNIRQTLKKIILPDGTVGSLGITNPVSFMISVPMHHDSIINYMSLWFQAGQDPIIPLVAFVPAMLKYKSQSGKLEWTVVLETVSISEMVFPGHRMGSEKMAVMKYRIEAANMLPPLPFF